MLGSWLSVIKGIESIVIIRCLTMKIGKRKLRMSSGEVRTFRSEAARDRFERVAKAVKHGWRPEGKAHNSDAENAVMVQQTKNFGRMALKHG